MPEQKTLRTESCRNFVEMVEKDSDWRWNLVFHVWPYD
jgi:hypothetical protein